MVNYFMFITITENYNTNYLLGNNYEWFKEVYKFNNKN